MCCGSSAAPTRSTAISKLNTRRSQTGYGFFDQDKTKRPRAGEILCWIFVLCLMLGPWIAWLIGEPYRRNIVRKGALCALGYRWTYAQPRFADSDLSCEPDCLINFLPLGFIAHACQPKRRDRRSGDPWLATRVPAPSAQRSGGGVSRERRAIASAREGLRLFGNIHPERTPPGFCQCFTRRPQFGHGVALVFSPASRMLRGAICLSILDAETRGHAKNA